MIEKRHAVAGLLAASAVALAGYAMLSVDVRAGKTRTQDAKARRKILKHASKRARQLAEATGHIGKWYTHVPLALGSSVLLLRARKPAAAGTLAAVSLGAAGLSPILDRVHDHRTPPPGKGDDAAQSYPSGHALETTAVALVAAWLVARENIAPLAVALPAALITAAVSGLGRLVLDRHWTTDSAAGYCAGIALGTAAAAVYEGVRR